MLKTRSQRRVVVILFLFLLFHQADKTVMAPLITLIMDEFQINQAQMGALSSLGIVVSSLLYPLWGYAYDRFSRSKLLAVASAIWGLSTSLSAVAPNYRLFMIARASTGIDDSSYPGLYSLLSDYFKPSTRGKIYGLMQMTGPLGYMTGIILATTLSKLFGWRNIFLVTGTIGIVIAVLIAMNVKERKRGASEPEISRVEEMDEYRITWQSVRNLRHNRTLQLLIIHGFIGLFMWNVLAFWLFHYLEVERGFTAIGAMLTMVLVSAFLAMGYLVGGSAGDKAFKSKPRGRILFAAVGTFMGGAFLVASFLLSYSTLYLFVVLLTLSGFFLAFVSPNVMATMHDITLPEVRSTAQSLRQLFMDGGAAMAPFAAGLIAVRTSLHNAIFGISIVTWIVGTGLIMLMAFSVPHDIEALRAKMRERSEKHL